MRYFVNYIRDLHKDVAKITGAIIIIIYIVKIKKMDSIKIRHSKIIQLRNLNERLR